MEKIILKGTEMHLSDDEFFSFCQHNADLTIERKANKEIIIIPPTGSLTGFYNTKIIVQLELWNKKHQQGLVFDSSAGFSLPDGSVKSSDASWLSLDQWKKLSSADQEKFAPVCPEFVVELKSKSDSLPELKTKMEEWLSNGIQLGWLIDPGQETVYVYRPNNEVNKVTGFEQTISGDPVLAGFRLHLAKLQHP